MSVVRVRSLREFIDNILGDAAEGPVWFRGEFGGFETPLLPRLFRPRLDRDAYDENRLVQAFRRQAPSYGGGPYPDRKQTD